MTQYVSTLVTTTVVVNDADPNVVVTGSGSIVTEDAQGIRATGTTAGHARIDGSVYASSVGIEFAAAQSSVSVSSSGVVQGESAGVYLGDGQNTITNAGQIRASDYGDIEADILNSGILVGEGGNSIINSGAVSGFYGIRAEINGYQSRIVNSGIISGTYAAIDLNLSNTLTVSGSQPGITALDPSQYGIFNDGSILGSAFGIIGQGPLRLVNSGLIQASNIAVSFFSGFDQGSTVTNSGTIIGTLAFKGGQGRDQVFNTGRMEGDLRFGADDDVYDGDSDLYDGRGGIVIGTVYLERGDDVAYGGGATDNFNGGANDDALYGNGGNDSLDGGDGNDLLDGGVGADVLVGGKDDDIYVIDNEGDTITERANEGTDTVRASISYALGQDVENLVLTGAAHLTGIGNDQSNEITGNDGNNILDGGAEADALYGGKGDDLYIVDHDGDTVTERTDEGTDTVRASVSHTLTAHVEHLHLTGTADLDGTGNDLANTLTGNSGRNALRGGKGDDTLEGGEGQDTALFSGAIADYTVIRNQDGTVTVVDKQAGRDGTDLLRNMEIVQFSDGTLALENRTPDAPAGSFTVNERKAADTLIATLAEKDADGDPVAYTFAGGGTVSFDSRFKIVGNQILVNQSFEVEQNETVAYTVNASDGKLATSGAVTITVRDVAPGSNLPPNPPEGSFNIDERSEVGATVATLDGTDEEGETVSYTFASAKAGSNGLISADERFKIVGNKIQVNKAFEVTENTPVEYALVASDGEATTPGSVTITINNVNRAPAAPAGSFTVDERTAPDTLVTALAEKDADGETVTYTFANAKEGSDGKVSADERFKIDGNRVLVNQSFEVTENDPVAYQIVASDGVASATGSVTITAKNTDQPLPVNAAPTDVVLSGASAAEYSAAGTLVGTLSAMDTAGDTHTYQLLDTAGGRFKLAGNQILVENGFKLDYEQAARHTIKVKVTDQTGESLTKDLVINDADINPEITAGTADHDVFFGGALGDVLAGSLGNDRLFGGAGADTLKGEAGNDMLGGGAGKDKLYGGKGKTSRDAFVFDTKLTNAKGAPNKSLANQHKDQILDFGPKYDSIFFDDAAFTNKTIAKSLKNKGAALDKPVKMKSSFFKVGDKAADKDDFFIYNARTKKLYFDVDGSGAKAMVEIASLKLQKGEGTTLTWKDFFFI